MKNPIASSARPLLCRCGIAAAVFFALLLVGVPAASAAVPKAFSDGEMHEMAKVLASDAATARNWFGHNVVIDGDTAVIGASFDNSNRGAVYVFVRHGEDWVQQAKLAPATLTAGDMAVASNNSIAIDGDTLVFGVYRKNASAGAAYVYTRTGTTWALQQQLTAPDAAASDGFGRTVAISGDSIAIGVPFDDLSADSYYGGSIRIFTRSGVTWSQQAKLTVPFVRNEFLGFPDVDLAGDTLVAGAGLSLSDGTTVGSAYVFSRVGAAWSAGAELLAADGSTADDRYGTSVEIDGGVVMVGAPGEKHGVLSSPGSVYVYRTTDTLWTQEAEIVGGDLEKRGEYVSLDGDTAVFGVPGAVSAVDVYRRTGTVWTRIKRLTGSSVNSTDNFGTFIGISGDTVIAGAPSDADFGAYTGSAYVFNINEYKTEADRALVAPSSRGVLANDYDADGDLLIPTLLDISKLHGAFVFGPGGSFIYTPERDFVGTATATYSVSDGISPSNTATITIAVTPATGPPVVINQPPTAVDDTATIAGNTTATLDVLANDTDVDTPHASLVATAFSAPALGALTTSASGDITYTPPANWSGQVTFTYKVYDGELYSAPATATITVTPVVGPPIVGNHDPVAVSDGELLLLQRLEAQTPTDTLRGYGAAVAIQADTAVVGSDAGDFIYVYNRSGGVWQRRQTIPTAENAVSLALDGDTLVLGFCESNRADVYVRDAGGTWSPQQVLGLGSPDVNDMFGYRVDLDGDTLVVGTPRRQPDAGSLAAPGSVYIFTRSAGVWTQRAELTGATESTSSDFFGRGVAVDGDTVMVATPQSGAWVFTRTGADWGTYDQTKLALGPVRINSSMGHALDIDGDVAIVGTSGGPVILDHAAEGWIPTRQLDALPGDDYSVALDGDTGLVAATGYGGYVIRRAATAWVRGDSVPWSPDPFFGADGDISDGTVLMGDRLAANSNGCFGAAFFFDAVTYSTAEDQPLVVPSVRGVLHNDYDEDGDILTPTLLDISQLHGTLAMGGSGAFIYSPDADFNGIAIATYLVADGSGGSDTATITIIVDPLNDAPLASPDARTTIAGHTLNASAPGVLANDTDTEGDALSAVDASRPAHASAFVLHADGSFTYTPESGFVGIDTFSYRAYDGLSQSPPTTVAITVRATAPGDFTGPSGETIPAGGSCTVTFTVGVPGAFDFAASGDPVPELVWSGATLPPGLVHSAAGRVGTISGLPADDTAGTWDLTLAATNASGTADVGVRVVVLDKPTGLWILKRADRGRVSPGDAVAYTLVTTNSGRSGVPNVTITDTYDPSRLTLTAGDLELLESLGGQVTEGRIVFTRSLRSDESSTITYTMHVAGASAFAYDTPVGNRAVVYSPIMRGTAAEAFVTVEVPSVTPRARDDAYSCTEGGSVHVESPGVLGNDSDEGGPVISASLRSTPAHASGFLLHRDGSFTYVPDDGYTGTDSFIYAAYNDSASDVAIVTIRVRPAYVPPEPADEVTPTTEATTATASATATATDGNGGSGAGSADEGKPKTTVVLKSGLERIVARLTPAAASAAPWCVGSFAILLALVGALAARRRNDGER